MPYDAAKALAATFCWRIRHVLTPLFGTDFPAMCIHPDERKRHGVMIIDPDITRRATLKANYYRSLEMTSSPRSVPAPVTTYHLIRDMDALSNDESADLKLPPIKYPRHRYTDSIASARDSSTEPYSLSPKSQSPCSSFTPINPPRSINAPPRSHATSPKTVLRGLSQVMRSGNGIDAISEDSDADSDGSSNVYSTPDCPSLDINLGDKMLDGPSDMDTRPSDSDLTDSDEDWVTDDATDKDYHSPPSKNTLGKVHKGKSIPPSPGTQKKKNPDRKSRASRPPSSLHFAREVKAAEALIRLHMNELETSETELEIDGNSVPSNIASRSLDGVSCGGKRRRASL